MEGSLASFIFRYSGELLELDKGCNPGKFRKYGN